MLYHSFLHNDWEWQAKCLENHDALAQQQLPGQLR